MPLILGEASCSREGGTRRHGGAGVRARVSVVPLVQPMPCVHGQGNVWWSTSRVISSIISSVTSSIAGGAGVSHPA